MRTLLAIWKLSEGGYAVTGVNHLEHRYLTLVQVTGHILKILGSKAIWNLGRVAAKKDRLLLVTVHRDDNGLIVFTRVEKGSTRRFPESGAKELAEFIGLYLRALV